MLALALASVLLLPGGARAATCQQSGPADNSYTVNVCFASPSDGSTATGPTAATATATVTGTSPGIRRMTFYLAGEHLLTDYEAPYTFTVPSDRYVDGQKALEVEAWMRDGFISQRASINLQFSNGVTTPPVNTNTFTPSTGTPPPAGQPFVVAAAGDGAGGDQDETDTVNLIESWNPNLFLYLGDVYEKGTVAEFYNWYGPTNAFYGRLRSITNPTIGNHEYQNGQAPGYFDYWNNVPHYYSFNANGWHFISLDSNGSVTPTRQGSPQYNWLLNDLDTKSRPCTAAYYHHPLFNIGEEDSAPGMADIWSLFTQKGVDLVLVGHDHTYQRWQPLDGSGAPQPNGVTQIVVGTGGHAIGSFHQSDTRVVASAAQFGALRLELNNAGASYQFVTVSGQTLDSGSVDCGLAADTTNPSTPTGLTANGTYKTRIDLSWNPSSDNVGVTGYELYRDEQPLATIGPQTGYADTTVQPGSTHTYTVRALDAANNLSAFSDPASATAPTVASLFSDGFESGDLSSWTQNNGLLVQTAEVFAGAHAARGTTNGSAGASAYKQLAQTESDVYYVARFKILSQAQNVNVLRLRNSTVGAGALATLFVTTTNRVGLRNDVLGGSGTTSTTVAAPGVWHTAQVHLAVNGLSSQIEVWIDGIQVPELSQIGVDLGTNPVGRLELGDPTVGKIFDATFDEVAYDREFIPDVANPTAPTNLTADGGWGRRVDLSWTAGTDDVAVTSYDIYRNDSLLASTGPGTTYADTTTATRTSYSYRIVAKDAAGKLSPSSTTVFVTTGDAFSDDFESGDLSRWTSVNGLVVQQSIVDRSQWAARATSESTSAGASAAVLLVPTVSELYYRARFQIISQGANSVSLLRFRTPAATALASAFVSSTGKLSYRNDGTGTFTTSAQSVSHGIWHEVQMHLLLNDASSLVEVWLDGVKVITQADTLSTGPIGRLEIGDPDPSTTRSYDVVFDNVVADPAFIQDAARPTAPSNLRTTAVTATQVDLAWDAGDDDVGVTGYRIYRDSAPIADVDGLALAYSDTTAGAGDYSYSVTALDAVGHESVSSGVLAVTTLDTIKPTAPAGLVATPLAGANQINLSWTAATDNFGVSGYRIYRGDSPNPIGTVGAAETTFSDTTVAPVTAYTYSVSAVDAAGNESDRSNAADATSTDTVAPQSPSELVAVPLSDSAIYLRWGAGSDNVAVTGYKIYRNDSTAAIATVSASARLYADNTAAPDTTYTYTVRSEDAAGNMSAANRTSTATTWMFTDGFEAGNLSRWTGVAGLVAQNGVAAHGSWGARATATGRSNVVRWAHKQLPSTQQSLFYHVNLRIMSDGKSLVDLLRLDTDAGGSLVTLFYNAKRKLGYRNDVTGQSTLSSATLSVGQWYSATVFVSVNGGSSRVEVWLNFSKVLSKTDSLGTTPIGRIELGDRVLGHKYDVAFDNVFVAKR